MKQCQELPGSQLFQYRGDDGRVRDVGSADVNAYLRARWARRSPPRTSAPGRGRCSPPGLPRDGGAAPGRRTATRVRAIDAVARVLGNTRAVCRRCYVHPAVIDASLDGSLARSLEGRVSRPMQSARAPRRLETAVLALFQRRLRRDVPAPLGPAARGGRSQSLRLAHFGDVRVVVDPEPPALLGGPARRP